MGRPRQYATASARQAAYWQRMKATTVLVDRAPFARIDHALITLQDALWRARLRGHPLAHALYQTTPVETLEAAAAWILTQTQQSALMCDDEQRPDATKKGRHAKL